LARLGRGILGRLGTFLELLDEIKFLARRSEFFRIVVSPVMLVGDGRHLRMERFVRLLVVEGTSV
jgi:hypothetical protein